MRLLPIFFLFASIPAPAQKLMVWLDAKQTATGMDTACYPLILEVYPAKRIVKRIYANGVAEAKMDWDVILEERGIYFKCSNGYAYELYPCETKTGTHIYCSGVEYDPFGNWCVWGLKK